MQIFERFDCLKPDLYKISRVDIAKALVRIRPKGLSKRGRSKKMVKIVKNRQRVYLEGARPDKADENVHFRSDRKGEHRAEQEAQSGA